MNKDVAFMGTLGFLVSILFLVMTIVEIPFYPQEVLVQKVVLAALAGSAVVMLVGVLYGRGKGPKPEPRKRSP